LYDPSSLTVLTSTTGVPKYRIAGSLLICILQKYGGMERKWALRFLRSNQVGYFCGRPYRISHLLS
jgi:hypothetical protein